MFPFLLFALLCIGFLPGFGQSRIQRTARADVPEAMRAYCKELGDRGRCYRFGLRFFNGKKEFVAFVKSGKERKEWYFSEEGEWLGERKPISPDQIPALPDLAIRAFLGKVFEEYQTRKSFIIQHEDALMYELEVKGRQNGTDFFLIYWFGQEGQLLISEPIGDGRFDRLI